MSWTELEWPDLSPLYPEPHPLSSPPSRPPVPVDIAAQIRLAEQRRGVFTPVSALVGAALFAVGLALYRASSGGHERSIAALVFMGAGVFVAFVVPALAVLLFIGPHWRQRTQHLQLTRWDSEYRRWLANERQRYIATLPTQQRAMLRQALAAHSSPPIGGRVPTDASAASHRL